MQHVEALLSPDLIIVGGGISKEAEKWVPLLEGVHARIVPATLHNDAGIVGAAVAATGMATTRTTHAGAEAPVAAAEAVVAGEQGPSAHRGTPRAAVRGRRS
jgi:polyphosphate glucokinase